ncbi:calmodulin-alpha-like [Saccostrea echinata]|uniref:calmodulin-alpha-like n=1 Tax=Saccostrea echinata TaxID=191078 RepID=UPI002A802118|nr:calmodulin-alpha-like [Saccostrea echinata]XP_061183242.1 calmodulin-alpha-like [Saccostrea echinata]
MEIGVSVKQNRLPKEKRAELLKIFKAFDENGDGKVSKHELARASRRTGSNKTLKDIEKVLRTIHTDSDGYITFPELEKMLAGQSVEIDYEDEMLLAKFNEFDLDGDGSITKKELKKVLRSMGCEMPEEEAEAMIREADKNGDGVISFDEFKAVLTSGDF